MNVNNRSSTEEEKQFEISFTKLSVSGLDLADVASKIANAINVQLKFDAMQELPFVAPNRFANVSKQDKVFVFGTSGSGKSRLIFELTREKLKTIERVYILNPRQAIGEESGRTSLRDLIRNFAGKDAVIWDNFPDDLLTKDEGTGRKALEIVASKDVGVLLIALKPKYMEAYRNIANAIVELYTFEIAFDRSHIKELLNAYGLGIVEFKDTFSTYIEPEVDKIAEALWNNEPLPLMVLNYLNEIVKKKHLLAHPADALIQASSMLGRTEFYEHQFKLIQNQQNRKSDTDFLYTLKLCYELGLVRSRPTVERLQETIFGTHTEVDALEKLSSWVYPSDSYYSIHDAPREAVRIPEYQLGTIIHLLIRSFFEIIPSAKTGTHSLGLFLGRHVNLFRNADSYDLGIPNEIYQFMKQNIQFEKGMGEGAGESFVTFNDELQHKLLKQTEVDSEFARGLGASLASAFPSLGKRFRESTLSHLKRSVPFARGFGEGLGREFPKLPEIMKNEIYGLIPENEYSQFTRGLSTGIGYNFFILDIQTRIRMFEFSTRLQQFAVGLGFGLGNSFTSLAEEVRKDILPHAEKNSNLTRGFGLGIGRSFQFLSPVFRSQFLDLADHNPRFAWGMGYEIGYNILHLDMPTREIVLRKVESNPEFAFGIALGLGIAFDRLTQEFQDVTLKKLENNPGFSNGFGYGFGFAYQFLSDKARTIVASKLSSDEQFAEGFGHGIGYMFSFFPSEFQKDIFKKMENNAQLCRGLGHGIGQSLTQQFSGNLQDYVLSNSLLESELARGIGSGLGTVFEMLSEQSRRYVLDRAKKDGYFALGFGSGTGEVFTYFSRSLMDQIMQLVQGDRRFAEGFAYQIAKDLELIPKELKTKFLELAEMNGSFAFGMGMGVGISYNYLEDEVRKEIVKVTKVNLELARGFGAGIGFASRYLAVKPNDPLLCLIQENVQMEKGFGLGQGLALTYFAESVRDITLKQSKQSDYFAEGVGEGVGLSYRYLETRFQEKCWKLIDSDNNFARGFGKGIARVFSYLDRSNKENVVRRTSANHYLSYGLGFGLGQDITYAKTDEEVKKLSPSVDSNPQFTKGLSSGLGYSFGTISTDQRKACFDRSTRDTVFCQGLGQGLAFYILHCERTLQEEIFSYAGANSTLAKSLGFALGCHIQYLRSETEALFSIQLTENSQFAIGVGEGLGYSFQSLDPFFQEKALFWSENNLTLAAGLAKGLNFSFRSLSAIIQNELVLFFKNTTNSKASFAFGELLGHGFPSLLGKLQQELLEQIPNKSEFASGLIHGLFRSLPYLDEDQRRVVEKTLEVANGKEFLSPQSTSTTSITAEEEHVEFPLRRAIGKMALESLSPTLIEEDEITFSGTRENYCLGFIDMMDSTKTALNLNDLQLSRYYSLFLNAMAKIVRNFDGKIIKNAGDCLVYYFPETSDANDLSTLSSVLESGLTMLSAHRALNAKLSEEKLPPLNYRISVEYGKVEVAKSKSSQSDDLFGSTMNICAKINSKAPANGMVIGEAFYRLANQSFFRDNYRFEKIQEAAGAKYHQYPAFVVYSKHKRTILDPFTRTSSNVWGI